MALYYLDTSALVKLYVAEPGTERMLELADSGDANQFAVLSVSQAELWSAVGRRLREGALDDEEASDLLDRFSEDLESFFLRQNVNDSVIDLACALLERHSLRADDALQLAGCLTLRPAAPDTPVFASADDDLLDAAEEEGLRTLNPLE